MVHAAPLCASEKVVMPSSIGSRCASVFALMVASSSCAGPGAPFARLDEATRRGAPHPGADAVVVEHDVTVRYDADPGTGAPIAHVVDHRLMRLLAERGRDALRAAQVYSRDSETVVAMTVEPKKIVTLLVYSKHQQ